MSRSEASPPRRRRTSHVPGTFLGFSLQVNRMLVHSMAADDGAVVSLEVLGDTGVTRPDGSALSEEHKSRTSDANPVQDAAVDLWKTLRNWVEAVATGDLDAARTTFRLYLTRPFTGYLVERFAAARTVEEAKAALADARTRLLASNREQQVTPGPTATALEHVRAVLDAPAEIVTAVLVNFALEVGTGDSVADTSKCLAMLAQEAPVRDVLRDDLLGWIKSRVDARIQAHLPACISVDEFRVHLRAKLKQLCNQLVLASVAPEPGELAVAAHCRVLRPYIRQLQLIDADEEDVLRAATDYLWAAADRVKWGQLGEILPDSLDSFEKELRVAWKNKKKQVDIGHSGQQPEARGALLYAQCCDHTAKLDGREPPPHFCRGSLHALADDAVIGWHPDYERLLQPPNDTEDGAT